MNAIIVSDLHIGSRYFRHHSFVITSYSIHYTKLYEISSIIIAVIIAPPLAYFFAGTVVKLYHSQASLQENEEKYRAILDNIEDGYFEVDLKGNFTFFNNSVCRILGYSPRITSYNVCYTKLLRFM